MLVLFVLFYTTIQKSAVLNLKTSKTHIDSQKDTIPFLLEAKKPIILMIYQYSCLQQWFPNYNLNPIFSQEDLDEFYSLSRELLEIQSNITFATLDSYNAQEIVKTDNRYSQDFSKLLYFHNEEGNEEALVYQQSSFKKEQFMIWYYQQHKIYVRELNSQEEIKKIIEKSEQIPVIIFYGDHQDDPDYFVFEQVATTSQTDAIFAYTTIQEAKELSNIPFDIKIVFYKNFDQRLIFFQDIISQTNLEKFLVTEQSPVFQEFNDDAIKIIYQQGHITMMLFLDDSEDSKEAFKLIDIISNMIKQWIRVKFFYCLSTNPFFDYLREYVGISYKACLPNIMISNPRNHMNKFQYFGDLTQESLSNFIDQFLAGRLDIQLKSEPIPDNTKEDLTIVVGNNFEEVVLRSEKHVLILFYTLQCKKCLALFDVLIELKATHPNTIFAVMNIALNDVYGLIINQLPSLKLWKLGSKQQWVDFTGRNTKDELIEFLVRQGAD